jgi:hypothetical protein
VKKCHKSTALGLSTGAKGLRTFEGSRAEALLVRSHVHSHVSPSIVNSLFSVYPVSQLCTVIFLQGSGLGCLVRTNVSFVQGRRSPYGKPGQSPPRGWGAWCVLFGLSGETTRDLLLTNGGRFARCSHSKLPGGDSTWCNFAKLPGRGLQTLQAAWGGWTRASCRRSELPGYGMV